MIRAPQPGLKPLPKATEEAQAVANVEEEEPTEDPTPTPTPQPTDTPLPTSTPTGTPTPLLQPTKTPVVTPTPTIEPTPTVELDLGDPADKGPLQTSLDILTILSVSAENRETFEYFSELAREDLDSPSEIQDYLKLSRTPFAFQAERVQGVVPPVVRVFVQYYINSPTETIDFEMVQEDGRWRINAARLVLEDPPPATVAPAPEEGEVEETAPEETTPEETTPEETTPEETETSPEETETPES